MKNLNTMSAKSKKLEAIQVLQNAFEHNAGYKKTWQDFIELVIAEELEEAGVSSLKKIKRVRSKVAARIFRLFDPVWWEKQERSKTETQ